MGLNTKALKTNSKDLYPFSPIWLYIFFYLYFISYPQKHILSSDLAQDR